MRGTMVVARCICGAPVIGSHHQPRPNRLWCGECVSFVDAAIRGADAFHGYLPEGGMGVIGFMQRLEMRLIEAALERAQSVAGAARLLGFNRTTLVEKLKRAREAKDG
jgi:DNA-binding NtrC family response regulator